MSLWDNSSLCSVIISILSTTTWISFHLYHGELVTTHSSTAPALLAGNSGNALQLTPIYAAIEEQSYLTRFSVDTASFLTLLSQYLHVTRRLTKLPHFILHLYYAAFYCTTVYQISFSLSIWCPHNAAFCSRMASQSELVPFIPHPHWEPFLLKS